MTCESLHGAMRFITVLCMWKFLSHMLMYLLIHVCGWRGVDVLCWCAWKGCFVEVTLFPLHVIKYNHAGFQMTPYQPQLTNRIWLVWNVPIRALGDRKPQTKLETNAAYTNTSLFSKKTLFMIAPGFKTQWVSLVRCEKGGFNACNPLQQPNLSPFLTEKKRQKKKKRGEAS